MKINKFFRAGAALALAGALCACSVQMGTNREPKSDAVVAKPSAGDSAEDMSVTYGAFKKEYAYYLKAKQIDDDTAESVEAACRSQRSNLINSLINEQIILQKAKEMGIYELSDDEMTAVEESYNQMIDQQVRHFGQQADYGTSESAESGESVPEISEEEKTKRGNEEFDAFLESCGMSRDDLLMWARNGVVTNKVYEEIGKGVDYAEAEKMFEDYTAEVEKMYKENLSQYEQGRFSSVWVPEGSRFIKHILLEFDDDTLSRIKAYRTDGDDEAADKLRAEKAEEFKDKISEVESKLDAGEDFETLMMTYSSDSAGSSMYPDGYTVIPNGTSFMKEFQEAAFVPEKPGDRTTCVTDYGVHIVIYAGDARISDEAKKQFTDYIFEQKKQAEVSEKLQEWKDEYKFEIDYDALRIDSPEDNSSAAGDAGSEASAE